MQGDVCWMWWPGYQIYYWPEFIRRDPPADFDAALPGSIRAMAAESIRESMLRGADTGGRVYGEFHAAGWPWPALYVDSHSLDAGAASRGLVLSPRPRELADELNPLGPIALRLGTNGNPLPYRPIWRGFIANTLIYSVVWLIILGLLITGTAGLRRARRARRGQCRRCGYDRRGLASAAVCPECGKGA